MRPSTRDVAKLFADVEAAFGAPDVVVYNASYRTRGPFAELDPAEVEKSLMVTAFGGFLVAQEAAKRMLPHAHGAILFTGASASVKGYAQSAPFAMGKFALRGLAQSMARELSPQGIHVAHFVIDGGIRSAQPRRSRRTSPTACSIPTPSRKPISISCGNTAAPGPGRSSCGPGSSSFETDRRRPSYNRTMPGIFANAALVALVSGDCRDCAARAGHRAHKRAAAPRTEPAAPAVPVDKRDSVVAAPGAFNGRPYWLALAQCGGIYFKLNILYTDVAVHARVVNPDPQANAEFTRKLNEAIKTATTFSMARSDSLMTDRGLERDDAVLTYDGQSRAAGDRLKTIEAALAAARPARRSIRPARRRFPKQCSEPLAPTS